MTHVSLFSGAGGFDIAAEKAGFKTIMFCEKNRTCRKVLQRHWPAIPIVEDIRAMLEVEIDKTVTLISGGDPCPIRSRARGNKPSAHPDLSGYFLAVVGKFRPRWVVRENVSAPDVIDFETGLDVLGYRSIIATSNAASYTGQNRVREIVIGCSEITRYSEFTELFERYCRSRIDSPKYSAAESYPCLTTHPWRYDTRDGYVWEEGSKRLRVADEQEREILSGFPEDWLTGLSFRTVARITGNAMIPQQVLPILQTIAEVERRTG